MKLPKYYVRVCIFFTLSCPSCLANGKHRTENLTTQVTKNQKRSFQNTWWARHKSQKCVENYRITFLCLVFEISSTPPRLSSSSLPNKNGKPVVTKKNPVLRVNSKLFARSSYLTLIYLFLVLPKNLKQIPHNRIKLFLKKGLSVSSTFVFTKKIP